MTARLAGAPGGPVAMVTVARKPRRRSASSSATRSSAVTAAVRSCPGGGGKTWARSSLPEAHVHVVVVAAGGVADVVDPAAAVARAPAVAVADLRRPVAALPDDVLDLERRGVPAEPLRDPPAFGELG